MQTDLFLQGQRPAVNVGISVSRVGGSAQVKAMKQVAGTLRLDLASYRELQAFSQFGSDLDKATQQELTRGARMTELLKQGRYAAMDVEDQVVAIFAGDNGFLDDMPVRDTLRFRDGLVEYMHTVRADLKQRIATEGALNDAIKNELMEAITAFKSSFIIGKK